MRVRGWRMPRWTLRQLLEDHGVDPAKLDGMAAIVYRNMGNNTVKPLFVELDPELARKPPAGAVVAPGHRWSSLDLQVNVDDVVRVDRREDLRRVFIDQQRATRPPVPGK